uniref:CHK domain-containing protein n=1 Tax=Rhabditophanes sp. KR3021 TaxID=114890 RepID=A0AC35TIW1_9BILA
MEALFVDPALVKTTLDSSQISLEWIIQNLEVNDPQFNKLRNGSKIQEVTYFDVSNGKGYVSRVYKTTITFDNVEIKPYQCIVKIPTSDCLSEGVSEDIVKNTKETDEQNAQFVAIAHNREVLFYNTYKDIAGLKIPKCYGTKECIYQKQDGALIMELLGSNYSHVEFSKSLTLSQARMLLDQLNHLQSYFFTLPNQDWKESFNFTIDIDQYDIFRPVMDINWETIKSFLSPDLTDHLDDYVAALSDNYIKLANYVVKDLPREEGNTISIVHGDMHNNNCMFRNDSYGNPSDNPVILDWQIMYAGSVGADLARFLCFGTSPDVRREIETNSFPKYYQTLQNNISKKGHKFDMTWEMFMRNYELSFIDQSMQLVICLGFLLRLDEIPKDCEIWNARKFLIGTKILFTLKQAIEYAKKHKPEWLIRKEIPKH